MKAIAYNSPFVPVEWIAAHGHRPQWLRLRPERRGRVPAITRGVCPYAAALIETALTALHADALILTTICDQIRYAAALLQMQNACPVFLLNVPSTWQTPAVHRLYLDELRRLGRFLVSLGGAEPGSTELAAIMLAFDRARSETIDSQETAAEQRPSSTNVSLALLGGPLLESDHVLFDLIEQAGGRVVLDATENSVRTSPRRFDPAGIAADPLEELADAYFDGIPDAFRRPNHRLYEWLGRQLPAREVRGIIFRRYVWCDLWHAELPRVRQCSGLPVLELDVGPDDLIAPNRVQGRLEAFLETIR
jgi:hypothetical protein